MQKLTILSTEIRQDADGRYCLNDCHRAAGGIAKDAPAQWLRTISAKKLIAELIKEGVCNSAQAPVVTVNDGINNGTYACRELVYAYGEWISASFHLTVIRAFDAMVTKGLNNAEPLTRDQKIAEAFLLLHEDHEKAKQEIAELTPKAEGFERLANSKGRTNLREVGKELQIGSKRGIEFLREIKWTFRDQAGRWKAYAGAVDAGYVEMKYTTYINSAGEEVSTQQVFVTPKGMTRLAHRLGMQ